MQISNPTTPAAPRTSAQTPGTVLSPPVAPSTPPPQDTSPANPGPGADRFEHRCEAGKGIPIRICAERPSPPRTLPVKPHTGPLLKPWPGLRMKPWINLPHIFKPHSGPGPHVKPHPGPAPHGGPGPHVCNGNGIPIRIS